MTSQITQTKYFLKASDTHYPLTHQPLDYEDYDDNNQIHLSRFFLNFSQPNTAFYTEFAEFLGLLIKWQSPQG